MSKLHKVFISYHHELDSSYRARFEQRFDHRYGTIISGAVGEGDIPPGTNTERVRQRIRDEYLRDSSVTVVLVGALTWQRKHVDWEISSSIGHTDHNPRSGVLGIILPTYYRYHQRSAGRWSHRTIPPRLVDNVPSGFATLHEWSEDPAEVQGWIHDAYLRKARIAPNNARVLFAKNRTGDEWLD